MRLCNSVDNKNQHYYDIKVVSRHGCYEDFFKVIIIMLQAFMIQ